MYTFVQDSIEQRKENESITRQSVQEKVAVSRKPAMQKRNKVAKKTTGFSHPQLVPRSMQTKRGRGRMGQPRFAQQTLSSQRRQQPKQTAATHSPLKLSTPALLHSSTPFTLQSLESQKERFKPKPVLQSAKKQQMEPPLRSRNPTSPLPDTPLCNMTGEYIQKQGKVTTSHPTPGLATDVATGVSSSQTNGQEGSFSAPYLMTENRKTPKIALNSPVDEHREPDDDGNSPGGVDDEQRLWMESISATLAHHSQQLETFKGATLKQLGQLQQNLSSQRKNRMKNDENLAAPAEPGRDENEKSEEKEGDSFDGRKLEGLMERLRELEGEEEVIRERWRSITYEDPPLAKPPILHPSEEHPTSKSGKKL